MFSKLDNKKSLLLHSMECNVYTNIAYGSSKRDLLIDWMLIDQGRAFYKLFYQKELFWNILPNWGCFDCLIRSTHQSKKRVQCHGNNYIFFKNWTNSPCDVPHMNLPVRLVCSENAILGHWMWCATLGWHNLPRGLLVQFKK